MIEKKVNTFKKFFTNNCHEYIKIIIIKLRTNTV